MKTIIKLLSTIPLAALFLDYAVAMQKVEPAGVRRTLRIISSQTERGTLAPLKLIWQLDSKHS